MIRMTCHNWKHSRKLMKGDNTRLLFNGLPSVFYNPCHSLSHLDFGSRDTMIYPVNLIGFKQQDHGGSKFKPTQFLAFFKGKTGLCLDRFLFRFLVGSNIFIIGNFMLPTLVAPTLTIATFPQSNRNQYKKSNAHL